MDVDEGRKKRPRGRVVTTTVCISRANAKLVLPFFVLQRASMYWKPAACRACRSGKGRTAFLRSKLWLSPDPVKHRSVHFSNFNRLTKTMRIPDLPQAMDNVMYLPDFNPGVLCCDANSARCHCTHYQLPLWSSGRRLCENDLSLAIR